MFELPGGWTPNCFLNPITQCQIMYWGVNYMLYTYDLHQNFGRAPAVKKFNPPANFSQYKHCVYLAFCCYVLNNSMLSNSFVPLRSRTVRVQTSRAAMLPIRGSRRERLHALFRAAESDIWRHCYRPAVCAVGHITRFRLGLLLCASTIKRSVDVIISLRQEKINIYTFITHLKAYLHKIQTVARQKGTEKAMTDKCP